MPKYHNPGIETIVRDSLDTLIDDRVRYTVRYANEHSLFYRHWFKQNGIDPGDIRVHEDLLQLPIVSGRTIREHQPPGTPDFQFLSTGWGDVFTIQETSGTSGTPKSFFLTWDDWKRYAEKYARSFVSQGFGPGDRLVVCASYGMNVGANTMTLAAHGLGMTIIPFGKCDFAARVITAYRPTAIVGSVFKLLRLARRLEQEGIRLKETSIARLVVGGESFSDESRAYLAETWGCPVFNTYGSTEGTMCGECTELAGLHVPEDLVHLDIYDPQMKAFVSDGNCGRAVLTTLLPVGSKAGTLLLNYDTEDTTAVLSRERCACGRTHMRIVNPQREAETVWILGTAANRVDVEAGVFQPESMQFLNGEYEAFLDNSGSPGEVVLQVNVECLDPETADRRLIEDRFIGHFLKNKKNLIPHYEDKTFSVQFAFVHPGELGLHKLRGRPKRLVDRRLA
ncbi:MAG: coenzyme F390 synthetase [Methanoregula sp.]|jgi:coenzyme F390 synthetase|uniref:coenzyme F390 synthetase n=1 Tax=Methanoregula sp. TaxID=2052170 RepID=UPI003C17FD15